MLNYQRTMILIRSVHAVSGDALVWNSVMSRADGHIEGGGEPHNSSRPASGPGARWYDVSWSRSVQMPRCPTTGHRRGSGTMQMGLGDAGALGFVLPQESGRNCRAFSICPVFMQKKLHLTSFCATMASRPAHRDIPSAKSQTRRPEKSTQRACILDTCPPGRHGSP